MSQPDRPRHPTQTSPENLSTKVVFCVCCRADVISSSFFLNRDPLNCFVRKIIKLTLYINRGQCIEWSPQTSSAGLVGACLLAGTDTGLGRKGEGNERRRGEKNNNLWAAAVVVCRFFGKLEAEERAECFDRCSRAYVEFCWGKICSHNVTHFPPAAPCTSALSSPPRTSAWRANNAACYWTDPSVRKGAFEKQIKADALHYTSVT